MPETSLHPEAAAAEPPAPGGGWAGAVAVAAGLVAAGLVAAGLIAAARRLLRRRAAERLPRLGFDASPHPMWVVEDRTLRVLAVNAAVVRRFGYTPDELRALT